MSPCKLRVPVSGPALVRRAEASSHPSGGIGMGETLPLTPSDYWLPQGTLPGLSGCALDALIRTEDDDTFCMLLWHTQQHMHMALIRSISMGHCTEGPFPRGAFFETSACDLQDLALFKGLISRSTGLWPCPAHPVYPPCVPLTAALSAARGRCGRGARREL